MTESQLKTMLNSLNIPNAYNVFKTSQNPPFIVYRRTNNDSEFADNHNYITEKRFRIEFYQQFRNLELEEQLENLFIENEIPYSLDETYIESEKRIEIIIEI